MKRLLLSLLRFIGIEVRVEYKRECKYCDHVSVCPWVFHNENNDAKYCNYFKSEGK